MQHYRTADWRAFRAKVIRLDGSICLTCGRSSANGAVLQVHHKEYLPGHKPWEYPFNLCETMCSGCHAALHGHIPPKFGWEHVGWDDLGDLSGTCDCCGTAIRYVFMLQHPKWHAMEVGEICCDNLTSTQLASGHMQSRRRYADRLKRFVSSTKWHENPDKSHQIRQKGFDVHVVPHGFAYSIWIDWESGNQRFATLHDAKVKAFEVIESGKAKTYFDKLAAKRSQGRI
jgi:hypothetical protein